MDHRPTALERAFEIARSGECANVAAIVKQLSSEGYATSQVTGPTLLRQLRTLCSESGAKDVDAT